MPVVGIAEVLIQPIFKGGQREIGRVMDGVSSSAGRAAGAKLGSGVSSGFSDAASKLKAEVSSLNQVISKSQGQISSAQSRIVSSSEAQAKAISAVRVAELKLQEVRANPKSKASAVAAAEEKLAEARRKAAKTTGDREAAEKDLAKATTDLKDAEGKAATASAELEKRLKGVGDASQGAEKKTSKLGAAMGKAFKWGAITAGTTAVAGLGLALTKGFGRLQAIENAKAKLTGLGHSAETVQGIMDNAMAAVKGTAFGLDEAASVAAGAVAAGVKPGKELEKTLKLTGDAASIAGVGMGEMGAIFNKVASSNKIQGDVIAQLNDAGIPIVQLMAQELGTTAEETVKLASAGKINFATFQTAMEKGLGGAALKSGETLQGAFKNTIAAVGRIGANLLSGVYPKIQKFFAGAINWLKPLEEGSKVAGAAVGAFIERALKGAQGLYDLLVKGDFTKAFREAFGVEEDSKLVDFLLRVRDAFGKMAGALPGIVDAGGKVVKFLWDMRKPIGIIAGLIVTALIPHWVALGVEAIKSAVQQKIAWAMAKGSAMKAALQHSWAVTAMIGGWALLALQATVNAVKIAASWLIAMGPIGWAIGIIAGLVAGFIVAYKKVGWFRDGVDAAMRWVGDVIGNVWSGIKAAIAGVVDWFQSSVVPVFERVTGAIGSAFGWLRDRAADVWGGIMRAVGAVVSWFQRTVVPPFEAAVKVLGAVFTWLYETIIKPVWKVISFVIDAAANVALLAFDLFVWGMKNVLAPAFKWLYNSVVKPVWSNIGKFIGAAWAVVKLVFAAIKGAVQATLGAVFKWLYNSVIKPVWNGIKTFINNAWLVIKVIFQAVRTFVQTVLAPIFTWLYNNVIKPVWDGIRLVISRWWAAVKVIFGAVKAFIRDVLAPAFRWFRDSVIKPVWNGIKSAISTVWNKGIKPVFKAFGDFIADTVAPAFQKGVDTIARAWEGIKKAALAPINFVIETVYNKGIVGTFNKIAAAIDSKARLQTLPPIGGAKGNKGAAGTGSAKKVAFRAKGGFTHPGWTVVGEEGPELVNFTRPNRVYTAAETQAMLAGREQAPVGALDSLSGRLPIGGWLDEGVNKAKAAWSIYKGARHAAADQAAEFVRGGLEAAAKAALNPLLGTLPSGANFGGLMGDMARKSVSGLFSFARGKDAEVVGGESGATYNGPLGAFHRPGGPITSGFGTSRGRYPHAGIDFAVPIGTAVRAMLNGVVRKIGWNAVPGRSGKGEVLDHANGLSSYYGHLSGWNTKPGDQVKAGQVIARSGNTGRSTGPHLHAELWKNGVPFNFASYLHDNGGVLNPGLSAILNNTGKPEAILNGKQWSDISTLAGQAAVSGTTTREVRLLVGEREFTAYMDERVTAGASRVAVAAASRRR